MSKTGSLPLRLADLHKPGPPYKNLCKKTLFLSQSFLDILKVNTILWRISSIQASLDHPCSNEVGDDDDAHSK